MLNCDHCNYFKSKAHMGAASEKFSYTNFALADINEPIGICKYSNFIFNQSVEEMDMDYPCNTIGRKLMPEPSKIDGKFWRYKYIKPHTKPESKRINKSA